MHSYTDLLEQCHAFVGEALSKYECAALKTLERDGDTASVKMLQACRLQLVIQAIGSFSFIEALLNEVLEDEQAFNRLEKLLEEKCMNDLLTRFQNTRLAINSMKHGKGPSLRKLLSKASEHEFSIQSECEGDVSFVPSLVQVDEQFLSSIIELTREIREFLEKEGVYL